MRGLRLRFGRAKRAGGMVVKLAAAPNPDYSSGERATMRVPARWAPVRDFVEASHVVSQFIASEGLGGGNWTGGEVRAGGPNGKVVARVSYNGRVWPPGEWQPGQEPLYG